MDHPVAIGTENREVFQAGGGKILNLRQRDEVVNLAIGASQFTVSAFEREAACLAVER